MDELDEELEDEFDEELEGELEGMGGGDDFAEDELEDELENMGGDDLAEADEEQIDDAPPPAPRAQLEGLGGDDFAEADEERVDDAPAPAPPAPAKRWRDPNRQPRPAPPPVAAAPRPAVKVEVKLETCPPAREPPAKKAKTACPECLCSSRHNAHCSIGQAVGAYNFNDLDGFAAPRAPSDDDDDLDDLDDDPEVLDALARHELLPGAEPLRAAPPPPQKKKAAKPARGKKCKACGAENHRAATVCACGARFVSVKGKFKEDRRRPCADCDAAIAAKLERCATCGSLVEYRARERAARGRMKEKKAARKGPSKATKRGRQLAAMHVEATEEDMREQERMFAAAAARMASQGGA